MIAVLEEDWGVNDQGTDKYVYPDEPEPRELSWYDSFKNFIGDILFGK